MRYCKNCGLLAPLDADHCPQCGAPLPPDPAVRPGQEPDAPDAPIPALTPWATLGALLLFAVPVVGFLFSLAWSFGFTKNPARRRLAQAYLIRTLVLAVIVTLLVLCLTVSSVLTLTVTPYYFY